MSTTETWQESNDWRTLTLTRETPHGVFRARIDLDDYPEPPEGFSADPVIDREDGRLVYGGETPEGGKEAAVVARVREAFELTTGGRYHNPTWTETTWERYVAAFHGGTVTWLHDSHRGGRAYAAVALPEYRRLHGCADRLLNDPATGGEWRAFIDGDVYVVTIERASSWLDGEPIGWAELDGPVGGYYGERWAKEEAAENLAWWIDHTAAGMLPLEAVPA